MLLILMLAHYISEFKKLIIAVASPKRTTMFGIKDCLDGLFFFGLKKLTSKVNFIIYSPPYVIISKIISTILLYNNIINLSYVKFKR